MLKLKEKEVTTHNIIVQHVKKQEKAGYVPIVTDKTATEIAEIIRIALENYKEGQI